MLLPDLLPTFIHIPAGAFLLGTPERDLSALAKAYGGTRESYREESPQHMLTLPAFEIARIPVTNALYAAFVIATGAHAPLPWRGPQPPAALRDHPVVDVSWDEANAFCEWLNAQIENEGLRIEKKMSAANLSILHSQFSIRLPVGGRVGARRARDRWPHVSLGRYVGYCTRQHARERTCRHHAGRGVP